MILQKAIRKEKINFKLQKRYTSNLAKQLLKENYLKNNINFLITLSLIYICKI